MIRRSIVSVMVVATMVGPFTEIAFAHPAAGIVVNAKGEVYFVHTGRGVGKIDIEGKLSYIHEVKGGGHWLTVDREGRFSNQLPRLFEKLTPEGAKPTLLYASGGAPFVVHRDGNLYYGSGYPDGDDTEPGFHTLTRLSLDGKRTLFSPALTKTLADLNEGVTGLATSSDGTLIIACPNAIIRVKTSGDVTKVIKPVVVTDRDDDLAKDSDTRAYHSPYLRGIDASDDGTIYAAVTGCRCVIRINPDGQVVTILKSEKPWTPTGVAVSDKGVFVLEYTNPDKPTDWLPRVRRLAPDGKVTTLADLTSSR
jgi:DNA-binding beta-propeller fold protein YncE